MESFRSVPTIQGRNDVDENTDANMEDVPLSNVNQHRSMPELSHNNLPKSKSGSLKRFFKLNKKGDKENDSLPQMVVNELKKDGTPSPSGTAKRFGLGLLSSHSKLATEKSGKEVGNEPSKSTLKSYLSTYWNNLTKKNKKHSASGENDVTGSTSEGDDNETPYNDADDKKVEEEVEKFIQESEAEVQVESHGAGVQTENQSPAQTQGHFKSGGTESSEPNLEGDEADIVIVGTDKIESVDDTENQVYSATTTDRNTKAD